MQPAPTLLLAASLAALGPALAPAQSGFVLRRGGARRRGRFYKRRIGGTQAPS